MGYSIWIVSSDGWKKIDTENDFHIPCRRNTEWMIYMGYQMFSSLVPFPSVAPTPTLTTHASRMAFHNVTGSFCSPQGWPRQDTQHLGVCGISHGDRQPTPLWVPHWFPFIRPAILNP